MELIQILNDILTTKNEVKSILGENDNIARYNISIHNLLAEKYNEGYTEGYRDRWYTLTGQTVNMDGPAQKKSYSLSNSYYTEYTPSVLTDIMRDVLNYRKAMRDDLNEFVSGDDPVGESFGTYPDYLRFLIVEAKSYGYDDGEEDADDDYEGSEEVEIPVINYENNTFTLSSEQGDAMIFYKLGEKGIYTKYEQPVTISEDYDIWYYAKLGGSKSDPIYYSVEYVEDGNVSFTNPPVITQEGDYVYINTGNDADIEYAIDNQSFRTYMGPVLVTSAEKVYARAIRNYMVSNTVSIDITFDEDPVERPENVKCYFDYDEDTFKLTMTLSCNTPGAEIWYAVSKEDGYYREYSSPVENIVQRNFTVFVYSELDGVESKNRLCYRFTVFEDNTVAPVQFVQTGSNLYLYTTTQGAKISYRYSNYSEYTNTSVGSLEVTPPKNVYVYTFAEKDGNYSQESWYKFNDEGSGKTPDKPVITFHQNNTVSISGSGLIKYSTDGKDPNVSGNVYDGPFEIKEKTTVGAVSVNGSYVSDIAWGTFTPYSNIEGGGSGYVTESDCFYISGCSEFTWSGNSLYYSIDRVNWSAAQSTGRTTLNPEVRTYFKGNINKFTPILGQAKIGGNILSLIYADQFINKTGGQCSGLFENATGLYDSSELIIPHESLGEGEFQNLFYGCKNMTKGPEKLKFKKVGYLSCFQMFKGCSSLEAGPDFTFNEIDDRGCMWMFDGCSNMRTVGKFDLTVLGEEGLSACFNSCYNLADISLKINANSVGINAMQGCFSSCRSLVRPDIILNINELSDGACYGMFKSCSGLVSGPDITATILGNSSCYEMFRDCIKLKDIGFLAANTLSDKACMRMFYGCSSLVSGPELKTVYLTDYYDCYKEMFYNCSSLRYIKALFLNNPGNGKNTANWVYGVAGSGTFEINEQATWSSLRGVNAIPQGWTVKNSANVGDIKSITLFNGLVTIKATNSDDIYYSVSDESDLEVENMVKYNGPFEVWDDCYVNACCKNSYGIWGYPVSKKIDFVYPGLVVSVSDNYVKIYCPYSYEYSSVQYQLYEYQNTANLIQNWTVYNGEFLIDKNYTVVCKGQNAAGNWSDTFTYDVLYGINAPVIEFVKGGGNTWVQISYPNPELTPVLYYKINDLTVGTPPEGWTQYTGTFKIDPYIDDENPTVVVSAIAKVVIDGVDTWTSVVSLQWDNESSVELKIPGFRQLEGTNIIYITYDGITYSSWDKTSVKIAYKFEQGGAKKYYTSGIDLHDAGLGVSGNVNLYARAESGLSYTPWNGMSFYYDQSKNPVELLAPEINIIEQEDGSYKLYITNSSSVSWEYSINTYFRITVTAWTTATHPSTSEYYNTYTLFSYADGFTLHEEIVTATIEARSTVDGVNYVDAESVEFNNSHALTSLVKPVIKVYNIQNQYVIRVQNPYTTSLDTNWFKMTDTLWGTGQVDEHKYDDWTNVGSNGTTIDPLLGYGKITAYYTFKGLTSPESDVYEFENPNVVTKLLPPDIEVVLNDGRYMVMFTNTKNEFTRLEYRIINTSWGGGVINEHKYDDWKACYTSWMTLDENLLRGTIQARTGGGEKYSEDLSEYSFVNEVYNALGAPEIQVILKNNTYKLKVFNKNLRAINYFRIVDTVWTGFELDPHKYDNWKISYMTDNQLDTNLVSGTIQAYSVYGSESTIDELVEYEFESEISINDTPPTITVTANPDGLTYRLKIVNNADTSYYPRIKWRIWDTEWTGSELTPKKYQYMGGGDYWIISQSVNENIDANLISGNIQCFATNESNHMQVYQRTDMTEHSFTNLHIVTE